MKTMKKFLLTGLLTLCAGLFGIGAAALDTGVAAVAETPAYTVKETVVFAKISDCAVQNGNFNLHISMPETGAPSGKTAVTADAQTIKDRLNAIDFFENIYVGDVSLADYGCVGDTWGEIKFGEGEPQNIIYLPLHADPTLWNNGYLAKLAENTT